MYKDDDDDFLYCLKHQLIDRIMSKLFVGKKSLKFIKFDGFQYPKMHFKKFQQEAIKYIHDTHMLTKLFSSSLKDDALKWYFSLPKKSIDKYEDLLYKLL